MSGSFLDRIYRSRQQPKFKFRVGALVLGNPISVKNHQLLRRAEAGEGHLKVKAMNGRYRGKIVEVF
jgi:hypothetical protein